MLVAFFISGERLECAVNERFLTLNVSFVNREDNKPS